MGILSEAANSPSQLAATLAAGVGSISDRQQVSFTRYSRFVSPLDGFVFWINTRSVTTYYGSLHQTISQNQREDETIAINHIVFTSESEISQFNLISSDILFVGTWVSDNVEIQVVFNEAISVYKQAGLWHYSGDAVYPALQAQLVQSASDIPSSPIVSNSLPIWLSQNTFAPVYPSYLVPSNVVPPYIAVHIDPEFTEPLGQFMELEWPNPIVSGFNQLSSNQLMKDRVQLTLYGFNNQTAIQYLASLVQYSVNTDAFGFCNSPAIKDEKRIQSEISAIAMKKKIDITASYYQSTANALAQRLIVQAALSAVTIT
ncbi:hypothetical protein [Ferrovum sp.]|uniref:hypothetical protein n=1 Tax=Ferrovum sp. TaxID=2609467 RepID=UPI00261CC81A|nr:hypothetical protein [Ferrovum sp.]